MRCCECLWWEEPENEEGEIIPGDLGFCRAPYGKGIATRKVSGAFNKERANARSKA